MKYAIPLSAVILLCAGCFSLTSFQTPEALPPGRASVGGGLAATWWYGYDFPWPEVDVMARYGIFEGVDVGGKVSAPGLSAGADVKWQFLKGPLGAAIDVGGSYGREPYIPDFSEEADILAAYPALIVGIDRIHVAARALMVHSIGYKYNDWRPDTTTFWYPQVFIGGSFGNRFRVMPELSISFNTGNRQDPKVVPGLGIAFRYGPETESDDLPMFGQ